MWNFNNWKFQRKIFLLLQDFISTECMGSVKSLLAELAKQSWKRRHWKVFPRLDLSVGQDMRDGLSHALLSWLASDVIFVQIIKCIRPKCKLYFSLLQNYFFGFLFPCLDLSVVGQEMRDGLSHALLSWFPRRSNLLTRRGSTVWRKHRHRRNVKSHHSFLLLW